VREQTVWEGVMAVLTREQRLMKQREKKRAYDRQFHNPYQLSGAAKRKKYGYKNPSGWPAWRAKQLSVGGENHAR